MASFGNFASYASPARTCARPARRFRTVRLDAAARVSADVKERAARGIRACHNTSITCRPIALPPRGSDQRRSATRQKRPIAAGPGRKRRVQEIGDCPHEPKEIGDCPHEPTSRVGRWPPVMDRVECPSRSEEACDERREADSRPGPRSLDRGLCRTGRSPAGPGPPHPISADLHSFCLVVRVVGRVRDPGRGRAPEAMHQVPPVGGLDTGARAERVEPPCFRVLLSPWDAQVIRP